MSEAKVSIFASLPELPSAPGPADLLFPGNEDAGDNALVNWSPANFLLYAAGYREAADKLVEQLPLGSGGQDALVYPVLFLYRHYLELHLKVTVLALRRLTGAGRALPTGHMVDDLWFELGCLYRKCYPDDAAAELDDFGRLVLEFAKVDFDSTGFRYPLDLKGNPTLLNLRVVNLRKVREIVAKMDMQLGGLHAYVSEHLQIKLGMEQDS